MYYLTMRKIEVLASFFYRSGETVSRYFNLCLKAILKLHNQLLKKPMPVVDDCPSDIWKCFKVYNINFINLIGKFIKWINSYHSLIFSFVELFRSTRWYLCKCVSAK